MCKLYEDFQRVCIHARAAASQLIEVVRSRNRRVNIAHASQLTISGASCQLPCRGSLTSDKSSVSEKIGVAGRFTEAFLPKTFGNVAAGQQITSNYNILLVQ